MEKNFIPGDPDPRVRTIFQSHAQQGDFQGWFDALYQAHQENDCPIPWDDGEAHPALVQWLEQNGESLKDRSVLVVGCGTGWDAREVRQYSDNVTAFDLSPTAIAMAKQLHRDCDINFQVGDLLTWTQQADLVVEVYTVQAVPKPREKFWQQLATLTAPGGRLVAIIRTIPDTADDPGPPWPAYEAEWKGLPEQLGLQLEHKEAFQHPEHPHMSITCATWKRPHG